MEMLEQALRGLLPPSEKVKQQGLIEPMKRAMTKPAPWECQRPPALRGPARSILEAWRQAEEQDEDPGEKSAPETAPDRRDTAQTPAAPLVRYARHFPAEKAARTAAAPTAKLPHARLPVAVG